MPRLFIVLSMVVLCAGCHHSRQHPPPVGATATVLTWNVNRGSPQPELTVAAIRDADADVVCLQEPSPEMEAYLRRELAADYPHMAFRHSEIRTGGGLAFLSRKPLRERAFIPTATSWFDGWIMVTDTPMGELQILNVHLRPPVSDSGNWASGYLMTGDDRAAEIERFYGRTTPDIPLLVLGDFNDSPSGPPVRWLEDRGMTNALPEFDGYTPTWRWRTRFITLKRRMDHILYSPELRCHQAAVMDAGASDHFPVVAAFGLRSE